MIPRYRSPITLGQAIRASVGGRATPHRRFIPGLPERETVITASASDALYRILRSIGACGNLVMSAYTCFRVVAAVRASGWLPVFVDVDIKTGSMLEDDLEAALAAAHGIKVVLVTHLYGIPHRMDRLVSLSRDHGATLIEDCAMSQGASHQGRPTGSFGDFAVFSFGLGKVLSLGAGGALVSRRVMDDIPEDAASVDLTRALAIVSRAGALGDFRFQMQEELKKRIPDKWVKTLHRNEEFRAARLSALASKVLRGVMQLPNIETHLEAQRIRSARWLPFIASLGGDRVSTFSWGAGDRPCCPGLPLIVKDRSRLQEALKSRGIYAARYFDYCAAERDGQARIFHNSRRLAESILMLPLHSATDAVGADIEEALFHHAHFS